MESHSYLYRTSENVTPGPVDNRGVNDAYEIRKRISTYEESTFIRPDSLRSSSILRLSDVLCQNIILHPFISLRRTCQVNRKCSPYICAQPFSLVLFLYHQQRKQGLGALYKGLSSELLVKGLTLGAETALGNQTEWPQEIRAKSFLEDLVKMLSLRGLSVALATPFLCSAMIETVQSIILVKDRPSFVDCFKDGLLRLTHLRLTPSNRMLPIWLLVLPTVFYHVSHAAIWTFSKACIDFIKKNLSSSSSRSSNHGFTSSKKTFSKRNKATTPKTFTMNDTPKSWQQDDLTVTRDLNDDAFDKPGIETDSDNISNSILASLISDVILLPIETVLNCLYIQGTRTIIDNCDETTVVLPVLTNYDGFSDCYQSILRFEGNLGLYKGLGAIILQYSVHYVLYRSMYYVLREIQSKGENDNYFYNAAKPKVETTGDTQRQTKLNEFMRLMDTKTRHSTPINPVMGGIPPTNISSTTPTLLDNDRFGETTLRYKPDGTPSRYNQL